MGKGARAAALRDQGGLCCYCDRLMWMGGDDAMRTFMAEHGLTRRRALLRQATAEHLVPKSAGGLSTRENIAAACSFCNNQRHRTKRILSPDAYRAKVQRRVPRGKWQ